MNTDDAQPSGVKSIGHALWMRLVGLLSCAIISATVLFARAVTLHFNHDENQFLAAGTLIAKHGLWPFRDYAFFHAPGEPFLLAILFSFTSHPLLVARIVSVAAATGTALLLFTIGARRSWFAATAGAFVFVFNPMTAYTASLAWNHSLAILCTLGAFVLLENPTTRRTILAGLCAGAAVMVRHSYPPVVIALAIYLAISAPWRRVVEFLIASAIAITPLALFPLRQVYFGLLVYPSLSKRYWAQQSIHLPPTMAEKLRYLAHVNFSFVAPATLLITAIAMAFCCSKNKPANRRKIIGVVLALIALLIGILAPTPTMQQYPFALVPFLILLMLYAIPASENRRTWQYVLLIPVAGALWSARLDVPALETLARPSAWVPLQIHRVSQIIPTSLPTPVFTLAPLFPVEAGVDFDPACATGPFAWRIARFLSPEDRAKYNIVGPDEWANRNVKVLILGDRNTDDIAESAAEHGFHRVQDEKAWSLWAR